MATLAPQHHPLKDGRTLTLRSATEQDAAALLQMLRETLSASDWLNSRPEELTTSVDEERAWVKQNLEDPNWLALVAEVDGTLVGLTDFRGQPRARLRHRGAFGMSVRPGWRGLGVGDLLLGTLLSWATAHPEIQRVELGVYAPNAPAIALYHKHGFEEEGRRKAAYRTDRGAYVDELIMARML